MNFSKYTAAHINQEDGTPGTCSPLLVSLYEHCIARYIWVKMFTNNLLDFNYIYMINETNLREGPEKIYIFFLKPSLADTDEALRPQKVLLLASHQEQSALQVALLPYQNDCSWCYVSQQPCTTLVMILRELSTCSLMNIYLHETAARHIWTTSMLACFNGGEWML